MAWATPGTYNWTQFVGPMSDGIADRMSRSVAFFWGAEAWEAIEDARAEGREVDLRQVVGEEVRALLDEIETETGHKPELVEAEAGRGAGATGVAVQLIEVLDTYGGAGSTLVAVAAAVRWTYRRLSEKRGWRVMVSLGAAEHLAAADLVDRVATQDIALIGSGDMLSKNHDRAYSGGDAFYVVMQAAGILHHYHVTAYGELTYIGTSPVIKNHTEASPPPLDWL